VTIKYVADHEDRALARVLQQFRGLETLEALLSLPGARAQELEDSFYDLISGRELETAEGEQLDGIGALVGQARECIDDATYRIRIQARIAINRSSGTVPELLHITQLLAGEDAVVTLTQDFPAAVSILATGTVANADEIGRAIDQAKAAGVRVVWMWTEEELADILVLDSTTPGQRLDEGGLAGMDVF
jgi:hypothetical protein